jgi:hypothetical protein
MIELRCSRDLGLRLGAIMPETTDQHRTFARSAAFILVRDLQTGWAMFWPKVPPESRDVPAQKLIGKSS